MFVNRYNIFFGVGFSLALCLVLLCCMSSNAQRPYGEIGAGVGGMNYIGDLNGQSLFDKPKLSFSAFARYNVDDRWAVAVNIVKGAIASGSPDYIESRNLSFRSDIWDLSARAEFNFVRLGTAVSQNRFSPFIFCGIGVFHFSPEAYYHNPLTGVSSWVALQPLGTEGQNTSLYPDRRPYQTLCFMLPFGLGFKYMIAKHVIIAVEYGFRKTWTDYIDDVSTTYVDPSIFENDAVAAALHDRSAEGGFDIVNKPGTLRGDDTLDDWYSYFNISFTISTKFLFGWLKPKRCYHK